MTESNDPVKAGSTPLVLPTPDAWKVAAWGLVTYAGTRVAALLLESASMAAAVAAAVIAEWGAGRLGVSWSDPEEPSPPAAAMVKRALAGAAIGAGVAGSTSIFLANTRALELARTAPSGAAIAIGLVIAGLISMRDELLLHGVLLRATIGVRAALPRVVACAITSGAAAYGDGATARGVAVQAMLGLVLGALWVRDRGAWLAWGASTAWLFATGMLLSGGVFDAHVARTSWGGGDAGPLAGSAAVVALLPFATGTLVWAARAGRAPMAARGGP